MKRAVWDRLAIDAYLKWRKEGRVICVFTKFTGYVSPNGRAMSTSAFFLKDKWKKAARIPEKVNPLKYIEYSGKEKLHWWLQHKHGYVCNRDTPYETWIPGLTKKKPARYQINGN